MTAQAITLLTEQDAAAILHVSPRTLRYLRAQGKIRYIRPSPRKVFYDPADIADYLNAQARRDEPACPSTSPPKVRAGTMTSSSKGSGIMDRLAARPNGMPKGLKLISGGKSR